MLISNKLHSFRNFLWQRYKKISSIEPTFGFTEFDILQQYRASFECSELGIGFFCFPFRRIVGTLQTHTNRTKIISKQDWKQSSPDYLPSCFSATLSLYHRSTFNSNSRDR